MKRNISRFVYLGLKCHKRILATFLMIMVSVACIAIPVRICWKQMKTVEGKIVTASVVGDEYVTWVKDKDGNNYIFNEVGLLVPINVSEIIAKRQAQQPKYLTDLMTKARGRRFDLPYNIDQGKENILNGEKRVLVVLVQYQDLKLTHSWKQFNDLLNGKGQDSYGSVSQYFHDQSYGKFTLHFDIVENVCTLPNKEDYYGAVWSNEQPTQSIKHNWEMLETLRDFVVREKGEDFNFREYDWDGDGIMEMFCVIYAGSEYDYQNIWPHKSGRERNGYDPIPCGNSFIDVYDCSPELLSKVVNNSIVVTDQITGIGTFCHEFSHTIGLPDFYDYNDPDVFFGMSDWSLMGSGNYNDNGHTPAAYTAFERMCCGWLDPIELTSSQNITGMKAITDDEHAAYLIRNDGYENEYYILENIQKESWNKKAYGHGLLITHVDYDDGVWQTGRLNTSIDVNTGIKYYDNPHCTIIPADNKLTDLSLAGDPYPGTSDNHTLSDFSTPAATLYHPNVDGSKLMHKSITDISENLITGNISFKFSSNEPSLSGTFISEPASEYFLGNQIDFSIRLENLTGDDYQGKVRASFIQEDEEITDWYQTCTVPANGSSDIVIYGIPEELKTGETKVNFYLEPEKSPVVNADMVPLSAEFFYYNTSLTAELVDAPNMITSPVIDSEPWNPTILLNVANHSDEICHISVKAMISQPEKNIYKEAESEIIQISPQSESLVSIPANVLNDFLAGYISVSFATSITHLLCTHDHQLLEYHPILTWGGSCGLHGDNLSWYMNPDTFDEGGEIAKEFSLKIVGQGEMKDFSYTTKLGYSDAVTDMPWYGLESAYNTVQIDNGVRSVSKNAFAYCQNITFVSLPNGLSRIGEGAFSGCSSLTSISIPASVTNIEAFAFSFSGIKNVVIPANIKSIQASTFAYCSDLATVSFPEKLSNIEESAFLNCSNLCDITCASMMPPMVEADAFSGLPENGKLHVPHGAEDEYAAWIDEENHILPKGWTIDVAKFSVRVECVGDGEATLEYVGNDNVPADELSVYRDDKVRLSVEPGDHQVIKSIVVNGRDFTDRLVDFEFTIKEATTIVVTFVDMDEIWDPIPININPVNSGGETPGDSGNPADEDQEMDGKTDSDLLGEVLNDITSCTFEALGMTVAGVAWNLFNCAKLFHEPCHPDGEARAVNRRVSPDGTVSSITVSQSQTEPSYITEFREKSDIMLEEFGAYYAMMAEYFGDEKWLELCSPAELTAIFDAVNATNGHSLLLDDVQAVKPQNITQDELETFVARINHTRARANGLPIAGANRIHALRLDSCSAAVTHAEEASGALGYASTGEMWAKEYADYYAKLEEQSKSVCATITLQFTQKLVMTRQAFRGTLTVFNGHENTAMRDVRLNLVVSDKFGHVATSHEFQINGESLNGFEGSVDLGSGWTLDAQATGEATILFIPTKYAAPTEPVEYSFGGTLTYIDPFTDLEVTRDLYPVTLTVKPSPNLDLTYFMQRDILGDNALTEEVEPMVPAEFALLIHNDGYGDATNVRMTTDQPKIIDNEKGLLIDFELLSSQVNGQDKVMALGGSVPADFGTIPAHSTAYAQWMLQASLLGHFTDYNVEATHVTSYGNEDLSLLNEVTIHELIHSMHFTDADGNPLVGWLVNDITDANDEPDMLYFSNAETASVSVLGEEQMSTNDSDSNGDGVSVSISVHADKAGWYYGCLVDPMAGRAKITAVTRQSDGASIDPQNFWLTEYTLCDGKDPIQEYMLHFADTLSTTYETYTVSFEMLPEEVLSVEAFTLPDKGNSTIYATPVTTMGITFSKAVDPTTFTAEDLKLTCRGKDIDLSGITLTTEDNMTFMADLAGLTTEDGYYVFTVQTAEVTDAAGYNGQTGKSADWTQFEGGLLVLRAVPEPLDAGSVTMDKESSANGRRGSQVRSDSEDEMESVVFVNERVPYEAPRTLHAAPAEGYNFTGWYMGDLLMSNLKDYTSVFIDHTNLTAQFGAQWYDLTVDWNVTRGTVTGAGTGRYRYGTDIALMADAADGYRLYCWKADGVLLDDASCPDYCFKIKKSTTVSPLFLSETANGLLIGDVNEDNAINVGDYPALVSLIVGTDNGDYSLEAGDINNNTKADVGDLANLVNMIMDISRFAAPARRGNNSNADADEDAEGRNCLYAKNFNIEPGEETTVTFQLMSDAPVSAFQTDLLLPDGIEIVRMEVSDERTSQQRHNVLQTAPQGDGSLRILCASSSNALFEGTSGGVLKLTLRAENTTDEGEYALLIQRTIVTDDHAHTSRGASILVPFTVGDATDIIYDATDADADHYGIYDLQGRRVLSGAQGILPAGIYIVNGQKVIVK